jgi:hypothetical protein
MRTNTQQIRIFLSSTFLDLSTIRHDIAKWLSGVFGAELVVMESFGSDVTPPNVNSVRRVRECELFVGIYAHRYGTVDPASGKSITELEFDEATLAFSSGTLRNILLYVLSADSAWLAEFRETTGSGRAGVERIREKAQRHTWTSFKSSEELLFFVVRDTYRELSRYFGASPLVVRDLQLPPVAGLTKPIGMEFLTSADRSYLIGRALEVDRLLDRLHEDPTVLLLGDSGVGKTSLIHAGLFPRAVQLGWRPIYCRPFAFPFADIIRQIQSSVYQGRPSYDGLLLPLLAEVEAVVSTEGILLVIDQFEDVLNIREESEVQKLLSELATIHRMRLPKLRVLITYRADLEGRLGEFWQRISGSPQGLPRVYLGGVDKDQAWSGVEETVRDLSIRLILSNAQKERLKSDLVVASQAAGFAEVYPPYIQMLIDHVWKSSANQRRYTFEKYQNAGGMDGVIGGYLTRQLEYAYDKEGHIRKVLISLVRSYGIKAQRTIDEILADTHLDRPKCETSLERLIDLRLVRHIDPYYEVSHDFIARRIVSELVDSEEKEFKRFNELLGSKSAAFQTTKSALTSEELLMLYKHRERIVPTEAELRLILSSWVLGRGPGLYWLLKAEPMKILSWLRSEEAKESLEREEKVSIVLLRKKLGETPLVSGDYSAFQEYQLSSEMASLISEDPQSVPKELLEKGLRHRREEVREASMVAIAAQLKGGHWEWVERLRKSNSVALQEAYHSLVMAPDIHAKSDEIDIDRAHEEFRFLKQIAFARTPKEAQTAFEALMRLHPPKRSLLFAKGLRYIRSTQVNQLLIDIQKAPLADVTNLLSALRMEVDPASLDEILFVYETINAREKDDETERITQVGRLLAQAVFRTSSPRSLPRLRKCLKKIRLTPSSREIIRAILSHGKVGDCKLVLDRIGAATYRIDFWNHTGLGQALVNRMSQVKNKVPRFLSNIAAKEEFWSYIPRADRDARDTKSLLPLRNFENRALYVRIAGYSMIGTAGKSDASILTELCTHYYGLIGKSAAIRLARLLGDESLRKLTDQIEPSLREGSTETLAGALRAAEEELFGLGGLFA